MMWYRVPKSLPTERVRAVPPPPPPGRGRTVAAVSPIVSPPTISFVPTVLSEKRAARVPSDSIDGSGPASVPQPGHLPSIGGSVLRQEAHCIGLANYRA